MTHNFYENQYGCIYYDKHITTPIGRVNFLNVATPGQKFGKYSATLYCDKNSTTEQQQAFQEVVNAGAELIQAKFGAADAAVKFPSFRDGDDGKHSKVQAAHGNWVIVANNKNQPDCFDSEGNDFDRKQLAPGMKCRLVLKPGVNEDGIFYQLDGIQVVEDDGVRFRQGPSPRTIAGTVPGGFVVGGGQQAIAQPVAQPAPAQPAPAQPAPQPTSNLAAAMAQPVAAQPAPAQPSEAEQNQNALDQL